MKKKNEVQRMHWIQMCPYFQVIVV